MKYTQLFDCATFIEINNIGAERIDIINPTLPSINLP